MFIREEQDLNATTTPSAGGQSVRWEVNKSGDYIDKLWFKWLAPTLTANTGTFARYCDFVGYAIFKEIRLVYGNQILQRIRKDELFYWHNYFESDESQSCLNQLVGGKIPDAQRTALAGKPQYFKIPLHTWWFGSSLFFFLTQLNLR